MDVRAGGKGSAWKLCIGVAVVCGVLVFAAGFLHRNAVTSAIDTQQTKSAAYASGKVADAVGGDKLSKQLSEHDAASLEKAADVPADAELRIFALDGTPVFASSGRTAAGDRAAITTAANGDVSRVIAGSDFVVYAPIDGKGSEPIAVAAVVSDYEALVGDASGPLDAMRLPFVLVGIVLLVAGLVLMVRGGAAAPKAATVADVAPAPTQTQKQKQKKADMPAKGRVSGFEPVPVAVGSLETEPESGSEPVREPAPVVTASHAAAEQMTRAETTEEQPKGKRSFFGRGGNREASTPAAEPAQAAATSNREVEIRHALEDQLEQLRTRIQKQEEASSTATRELQMQLEAATLRAEQAEMRTPEGTAPAVSPDPAERDVIERIQTLEADLARAKGAATEAMVRAEELQRAVDEAPLTDTGAPNAEALSTELVAVREQLAAAQQRSDDAQRLATEADQRAASIESVRGELEVRVAQLGAKAGELEQKATELEARLREAHAGGDAVRTEIATLTAALAASKATVEELESAAAGGPSVEELEATSAELARVRTELAGQMERAQAAEDRVATLEADVLAAEHGVDELPEQISVEIEDRESVAVSATSNDREDDVDEHVAERDDEHDEPTTPARVMWSAPESRFASPEPEPREAATLTPADDREPAAEPQQEAVAAPLPSTSWVAPARQFEDSTMSAQPEPESEPESAPESEPESKPESVVASSSLTAWVAPSPRADTTPRPEPESEPQNAPAAEQGPSEADGDGFSAVFAAAFGRSEEASTAQRDTDQPQTRHEDTEAESHVEAPTKAPTTATEAYETPTSAPQAPEPGGRYGDVWAEASPEPELTPEEPAVQEQPTVTSSLDDEPAAQQDSMSVDDDLWALRARLAHAADDRDGQDATSEGPSWS